MLPQELSTQLSRDLRKVVSTWQLSENIIYTKLSGNPGDGQTNGPRGKPFAPSNVVSKNGLNGLNAGGLSNSLNGGLSGNPTGSLIGPQLNSNQNSKLNGALKVDATATNHVNNEDRVNHVNHMNGESRINQVNHVNGENGVNHGKPDKHQSAFSDDLNDHHQPDQFSNRHEEEHGFDPHAADLDHHFNAESPHHELEGINHLETDSLPTDHPAYSNNKVSVNSLNRSLFPTIKAQQRPPNVRLSDSKLLDARLEGRPDGRLEDRLNGKSENKQSSGRSSNGKPPKGKQSNDKLLNRSDGRPPSGNSLGNKLSGFKLSSQNFKSSPSNSSKSSRLSSGKQSKSSSRSFGSRTANKNFNTNYDSSRSPANQLAGGKHASSFRANQTQSANRNQTNFAQSNVIRLAKQAETNVNNINYEVFQNDAQPTSKPNETANAFPDSFPDSDYLGDTADQFAYDGDRLSETLIYASPVNRFASAAVEHNADHHGGQTSESDAQTLHTNGQANGQTNGEPNGNQQQPPPSMMWTRLRLTRPNAENLMTIRPAEIPLFSSPIAIGHSLQNVLPTICDHVEIHNPSLILSLLDTDRHQAASFISQTAFIPMLSFSREYQISPTSTHVSSPNSFRFVCSSCALSSNI